MSGATVTFFRRRQWHGDGKLMTISIHIINIERITRVSAVSSRIFWYDGEHHKTLIECPIHIAKWHIQQVAKRTGTALRLSLATKE